MNSFDGGDTTSTHARSHPADLVKINHPIILLLAPAVDDQHAPLEDARVPLPC